MQNQLVFLVQGSAEDPYEINFLSDGDNLTALCSCPAGNYGNICKHRIALLNGDITNLVSDNEEDVETLRQWLPGTDVERRIKELTDAEAAFTKAKKRLSNIKHALARAMED